MQMLIDAAENRGPMLFARMGMMRAMEGEQPDRTFSNARKDSRRGKRSLRRDR